MSILSVITGHKDYWGAPHSSETDKQLIQTCYECGANRTVKADLQPFPAFECSRSISASTCPKENTRKAA